jgi:hypothetical protein
MTLLISRKMIFGGNLSFARVAGVGKKCCVVGAGFDRCNWEAVYLADSPSSKPSSATSTVTPKIPSLKKMLATIKIFIF